MKRKISKTSKGICKLTKKRGNYVKSHIIPESLTRPSMKGNYFLQHETFRRPVKRWTSWYDTSLVCREGEDYLSELDNWAVSELRRNKLVWSGWKKKEDVLDGYIVEPYQGFGIRVLSDIDKKKLRLFFLSLLWRAAASSLREFSEISIPKSDLERLRVMIVEGETEPLSFYPCQLIQLSTRGHTHNYTAIRDRIAMPYSNASNGKNVELPLFRFYFDGLISHMYLDIGEECNIDQLKGILVGSDNKLLVNTIEYQQSRQRSQLEMQVIQERFSDM